MQKVSASQISIIFCAKYLPWIAVALLGVYFLLTGRMMLFLLAVFSGVLARGANELVHVFYQRRRPYLLKLEQPLINPPKNLAFPSGHASFLLGISFFLMPFSWKLGLGGVLVALIVFSARVAAKVHWPSDILGSIVNAAVCATAVYYLFG